ncbi:MAG: DoxX family membrane protein [Micrococcales bacterium]|nr:DoxX family membrane protein [Micrococcales bacterium]
MSTRVKDVIGLVFRLVLAGVLGYAGLIKIFEEDGARLAVMAFRLFPVEWTSFLGWALPAAEILAAALLLAGLFTRWAALLAAVLMTAFVFGIASVWIRGYSIDCGCFGGGGDISAEGRHLRYTIDIVRDLALAGMAVWLVVRPRTMWSLDRVPVNQPAIDDVYSEDSERQV